MSLPHVTPFDDRRSLSRGNLNGTIAVDGYARFDQAVETVVVARQRGLARRDAGSQVVEFGPLSKPDYGPDPLESGGDRRLPRRFTLLPSDCRMQVLIGSGADDLNLASGKISWKFHFHDFS